MNAKSDRTQGTELIRSLIGSDKVMTINQALETKDGKTYGMVGGATGATRGDSQNESNGKGTDVSVDVGAGHSIYTETTGGAIQQEILSTTDILDHELVHGAAQMNGESVEGGAVKNMYPIGNGTVKTEVMPKEEAMIGIIPRPTGSKVKANENNLRYEQHKNRRVNYSPNQKK